MNSEITAMLRVLGWVVCFVGFISASLLQDNSALAEKHSEKIAVSSLAQFRETRITFHFYSLEATNQT